MLLAHCRKLLKMYNWTFPSDGHARVFPPKSFQAAPNNLTVAQLHELLGAWEDFKGRCIPCVLKQCAIKFLSLVNSSGGTQSPLQLLLGWQQTLFGWQQTLLFPEPNLCCGWQWTDADGISTSAPEYLSCKTSRPLQHVRLLNLPWKTQDDLLLCGCAGPASLRVPSLAIRCLCDGTSGWSYGTW